LKASTEVPVVLFPGSVYQLDGQADGLLLLSLISGRNPEFLIGHHVTVAGRIKRLGLPTVPTGYLLIDGGRPTSVSYMSGTTPIPADKPPIAAATALAGEQLGLKLIYLDAGSGAQNPIPASVIRAVREEVDLPVVVGGGIRSEQAAREALRAGADLIVVGTALENDPEWLHRLSHEVHGVPATVVPERS
jgi:putative glycerol-1-phosphate prenyltransferase